jgi:hypothetical protein
MPPCAQSPGRSPYIDHGPPRTARTRKVLTLLPMTTMPTKKSTLQALVGLLAWVDGKASPWPVWAIACEWGRRSSSAESDSASIIEAFFHARFFLEMAVRYAPLEAPPNPLPSGYAALLHLYGLR